MGCPDLQLVMVLQISVYRRSGRTPCMWKRPFVKASVVTRLQQNTHTQQRPIRIRLHDTGSTLFSVTPRAVAKQNEVGTKIMTA
jgi:hypothetical protein